MKRLGQILTEEPATVRLFEIEFFTGGLFLDGHLIGLSTLPSAENSRAKVWLEVFDQRPKFPAASERVGVPVCAEDVTPPRDASCREVPDGRFRGNVLPASPDELSGGGR